MLMLSVCYVLKPQEKTMYLDDNVLEYYENPKYLRVLLHHKCCGDDDHDEMLRQL